MKTLKLLPAGIVGAFLVTAGVAVAYDPGGFSYDTGGGGSTTLSSDPAPTCSADLYTSGFDVVNNVALTGDNQGVAAYAALGGDSSPFSTTPDKRVGAASIYRGGLGTTACSAVAGAACAGAAVTVSGTDSTGAAFTATLTDGGNWTHSDTAATNATNLAAAITAHASLSPYVSASAVGTAVGVAAKAGKATAMTIATSDAACCTVVNGADGAMWVPPGALTTPGISTPLQPTNGISFNGTTGVSIRGGAGATLGNCVVSDYGSMSCAGNVDAGSRVYATSYVGAGTYMSAANYVQAGTDLLLGDDIYSAAPVTDVAGTTMVISSQLPATTSTDGSTAGSNIVVQPPPGKWVLTGVTRAGTAGRTLTVTMQINGVTGAPIIEATEGTNWTCVAAASDAECVCNLYTRIMTTAPVTGLTAYRTDATCSDERLVLGLTAGAASFFTAVFSVEYANLTVTRGTNGSVSVPGGPFLIKQGTAAAPGFAFVGDADTGIFWQNANQIGLTAGGSSQMACYSGSCYIVAWGIAGGFQQTASTKLTAPENGSWRVTNAAGTGAGAWKEYPQTITCDADCNSPVTISSNVVIINCTDAGGCALGLAETNWSATAAGVVTLIAGTTQTGALTLADSAAVTELAGGVNWTPTAGDTLQLVYNPSALTWAEIARADVTP